ncbi:hypothetical protein [Gloeobacter morelensis]|uniref:Uncharacterized protein n=1 Tax=Gloeobacter morelensis MG652769 TaxID=2781736 RepID=A0ABY3PK23_9CYAN|nr:hypothetical protein [Gloeobacter morelensis]UFP93997.1 hypothetical protein ISF26_19875 [Gloeobacter morelensis MG652769]
MEAVVFGSRCFFGSNSRAGSYRDNLCKSPEYSQDIVQFIAGIADRVESRAAVPGGGCSLHLDKVVFAAVGDYPKDRIAYGRPGVEHVIESLRQDHVNARCLHRFTQRVLDVTAAIDFAPTRLEIALFFPPT